jgi:hypothetical protein
MRPREFLTGEAVAKRRPTGTSQAAWKAEQLAPLPSTHEPGGGQTTLPARLGRCRAAGAGQGAIASATGRSSSRSTASSTM